MYSIRVRPRAPWGEAARIDCRSSALIPVRWSVESGRFRSQVPYKNKLTVQSLRISPRAMARAVAASLNPPQAAKGGW